jgi:hypothetical protein
LQVPDCEGFGDILVRDSPGVSTVMVWVPMRWPRSSVMLSL